MKKKVFKRTGRYFVYILVCSDGTYYTGYTPDLKRRVTLHNAGKGAKYTKIRLPVALIWWKQYRYFKVAFKAELNIKKLSRAKKEALITQFIRPRGLTQRLVKTSLYTHKRRGGRDCAITHCRKNESGESHRVELGA
ncbi:MAG: GIY-YIG nuclease family protein [Candidatus Omnitrophota bacterium]